MLTIQIPADWRDLQDSVAQILAESGFSVEIEKVISTVRGSIEIDVYAQEAIDGRTYTVLCECKHWTARVPQSVIHGFRTVVADSGANIGYIISMAGFQSGAFTAAELTNLRLVTWEQFQEEFETTWIKNHLVPVITERLDTLFTCTEPLLPTRFTTLDEAGKRAFLALHEKYQCFSTAIFMMFSSYVRAFDQTEPFAKLPLRESMRDGEVPPRCIPEAVLDARGYRDLLGAVLAHGEAAIIEFEALLGEESN